MSRPPHASTLRRRHPAVQQIDAGPALRTLGLRTRIHPDDVCAYWYPSQEIADQFAVTYQRQYGHGDLGSFPVKDGVVGVTDLRDVLENTTDPGLADRALW